MAGRTPNSQDPRMAAKRAEGLVGDIESKVDSVSNKRLDAAEVEDEINQEEMEAHAKALQKAMQSDEYFVDSVKFNMVIGVFIIANMIMIGMEQDYGYRFTDVEMQTLTAMERLNKRMFWYIMENVFVIVFFAEMIARMYYHRLRYFSEVWNCMDFFLVLSSILDTYILTFIGGAGQMRALTCLRVIRMLRLVRFVRMLRMFRELWLIVNGLVNSMKTLGWVGLLLVCFLYVCAIFLTTQVGKNHEDYCAVPACPGAATCETGWTGCIEGKDSFDGKPWPYESYFGNVPRSMFTLFQILTLDSWSDDVVRHVIHRQPALAAPFLMFVLFTSYGLMNIIVGIIVENTLGAAQTSDEGAEKRAEKERKKLLEDLRILLEMSETGQGQSGKMTRQEFLAALHSPAISAKLEGLGLVREEAEDLFALMDPTGSGVVPVQDFVASCRQLVSGTKQKDIVQVSMAVDTLNKRLGKLENNFTDLETDVEDLSVKTQDFMQNTLRLLTGHDGEDLL